MSYPPVGRDDRVVSTGRYLTIQTILVAVWIAGLTVASAGG
jgi:hypothetical protein